MLPSCHFKETCNALLILFLVKLNSSFQLRELEAELEDERKARSNAASGKRKLEADALELQRQLEQANRIKEEGLKQSKKYQNQLKDVQRDLEDARSIRDDLAAQVKFFSIFVVAFKLMCGNSRLFIIRNSNS